MPDRAPSESRRPDWLSWLLRPYPAGTSYAGVVWSAFWMSLFVGLFLVVFQPFGLASISGDIRLLWIASFGLPCVPIIVIVGFVRVWLMRHRGDENRWRVGSEIAQNLLIAASIGGANYLYASWLFEWSFSWEWFLKMQGYTAAVSVFPIVGSVLWDYFLLLRKHKAMADDWNHAREPAIIGSSRADERIPSTAASPSRMVIHGSSPADTLEIDPVHLCFIKAEGNYVCIGLTQDAGVRREDTLIRATLGGIEKQCGVWPDWLLRCHRSYLVNLTKVRRVEGNAQGLILHLEGCDETIPVSRTWVSVLRDRLISFHATRPIEEPFVPVGFSCGAEPCSLLYMPGESQTGVPLTEPPDQLGPA